MSQGLYLSFVAASVALLLLPGPNVAVIVASSIERGRAAGLWTVAGTSAATVVQLALVVVGMAALAVVLAEWFEWLRWAGVAYLAALGVVALRDTGEAGRGKEPARTADAPRHWLRGFAVSLTNPKTLLFYGAFMPQFVSPGADAAGQLALLALTFLGLAVLVDSGWALLAARARGALAMPKRLRARLTGTLLLGAAAGLAVARRP